MSKKILIPIIIVTSLLILFAGTYAVFTDKTESTMIATLGTVDVSVEGLNLTNSNQILPGDGDPSVDDSSTHHVLSYKVTNLGTKSISTRQTILITALDKDEHFVDVSGFKLFQDKKEINGKVYVLANGKEKTTLAAGDNCIAVKYVFMGDSFDGSKNASILTVNKDFKDYYEIEVDSTGKTSAFIKADGKGNVSQTYSFELGLMETAKDTFSEECDVNIYLCVEAMQYRETDLDDWADASRVTRSFGSDIISIDSIPAYIEDEAGKTLSVGGDS